MAKDFQQELSAKALKIQVKFIWI